MSRTCRHTPETAQPKLGSLPPCLRDVRREGPTTVARERVSLWLGVYRPSRGPTTLESGSGVRSS
jgi:hypothetical protein